MSLDLKHVSFTCPNYPNSTFKIVGGVRFYDQCLHCGKEMQGFSGAGASRLWHDGCKQKLWDQAVLEFRTKNRGPDKLSYIVDDWMTEYMKLMPEK